MALHKVPGSKGKYMADDRGLRVLGMSNGVRKLSLEAAQRGVQLAKQYDPEGVYEAAGRAVKAGWKHENRAGAVVRQVKPGSGHAIRRMVMVDVLMGMESGRG